MISMSFRAISYSVFQDRVASLEFIMWPRLASVPLRWSLLVSTTTLQTFGANDTQENSKTNTQMWISVRGATQASYMPSHQSHLPCLQLLGQLSSILMLAPFSPVYKCINLKKTYLRFWNQVFLTPLSKILLTPGHLAPCIKNFST